MATIRKNWPPSSNRRYGIQCRAGFQCAPRMHEALGTTAGGGTLRFSPGYATTVEEIDDPGNSSACKKSPRSRSQKHIVQARDA